MEGSKTTEKQPELSTGDKDMRHGGGAPEGAVASAEPTASEIVGKAGESADAAKRLSPEEQLDALSWLLADEPETVPEITQTWVINVGTDEAPRNIDWTIKPLDADMMNFLREQTRKTSVPNRAARRTRGDVDFNVTDFNIRLVAAATVEPDLAEAARVKKVQAADPLFGPVEIIRHSFARKPGLVDQLAGKVMLFSGYDEEDVVRATPEITMMRAAGNSPR